MKNPLTVFATVASAGLLVCAQTATLSLDPIAFAGDGLSGSIIGTDASGTTYVLKGTDSLGGGPITVTYAQGPSFLSETAVLASASLTVGAECSISVVGAAATLGACELFDAAPGMATTQTLSEQINLTPVPIIGSVPTASGNSTSSSSSSTDTQQTITSVPSPSQVAPSTVTSTSGARKIGVSALYTIVAGALVLFFSS